MGAQPYKLHRVINAGRVILDMRTGFEKDAVFYQVLEEKLLQEDKLPYNRDKLKIGDHVLVTSNNLLAYNKGCKRAVVLNSMTLLDRKQYTVFLYDYGEFEDVSIDQVAVLRPDKDELPARTVIVQLCGIVPAKVVINLAEKKMSGADAHILTQESEWSRKANRMAKEWLDADNVQYLLVDVVQANSDGTVYGDIFRKLNKNDALGASSVAKSPIESLMHWLVDNHVAMENDTLLNSQLKVPAKKSKDRKSRERGDVVATKTAARVSPSPSRKSDSTKRRSVNEERPASQLSEVSVHDDDTFDVDLEFAQAVEDVEENSEVEVLEARQSPVKITEGVDDDDDDDCAEFDTISISSLSSGSTVSASGESAQLNGFNIPGRLLLRGLKARPPYTSLRQFLLPETIVMALATMGIKDLSELQKTACANFMRAVDLIVVAPPDCGGQLGKNGRLLCYVLPILRLVYEKYMNLSHHDIRNCSPEAIIIVNSFNTGVRFENFINSLLSYCPQMPLRVKFLCKDIPDDQVSKSFFERNMLPKGINVLITTVDYLDALLQTKHGAELCNNLRYVIFEELDQYMKNFWDDIVLFIGCLRQNIRCTQRESFQLAFSASRWSPEMEHLYKLLFQERAPCIVINAVNQVLRFAKVNWVVHHIEAKEDLDLEDAKLMKLVELLKYDRDAKIVVACSSPAVAKSVCNGILEKTMISAQQVTKDSLQDSLQSAMKLWKSRKLGALIISDDLLRHIEVNDATCLICYDTPIPQILDGRLRPISAERFGYLWSNIRQIERESEGNPSAFLLQPTQPLIAHFLMTGDEFNFYLMYKFAMSLEADVAFPLKLKEKALNMERDGSCRAKLCEGMRIFGYCNLRDPTFCADLHDFTTKELLSEPVVPRTGEIEVRVKRCNNPSDYRVQLLRHFSFENGKRICTHSYIKELFGRHKIMKNFYEPEPDDREEAESGDGSDNTKNCKETLEYCKIGAACAVIHPLEKTYTRARIVSIVRTDALNVPNQVRVFCIDIGDHLNPTTDKVYKLPAEFQLWKPLVVNLVLCCLKPPRREHEYRTYAEGKARDMFSNKIFNAKIWISIGSTIWVNPLIEFHVDPVTKAPFKGMSARLELISRRLADFNSQHFNNLISLLMKHEDIYKEVSVITQDAYMVASKDSISSDEQEIAKQQFFQLGDEYQWAFIERSTDTQFNSTSISVMFGYTPWLFYGVIDKFQSELKQLEKELHCAIEQLICGVSKTKTMNVADDDNDKDGNIFANYEAIFKDFYEPELVVAVKEKVEQRWMRAIILSRYESDTGGPLFEVFFVDYGDVLADVAGKDLFPLPNKFVNRIPFQVIAFKLDHIKPVDHQENEDQDWKNCTIDAFLDLVLPDSLSEILDVVALKYLNMVDQKFDSRIPCRYYSSMAFHPDGDELGSMLVTQGHAAWKPGMAEVVAEIKDKFLTQFNANVNEHVPLDDDMEANRFEFGNFEDENDMFDVNLDFSSMNSMVQDMLGKKNGFKKMVENTSRQEMNSEESERQERYVPALPGSSSRTGRSSESQQKDSTGSTTLGQLNIVDGEHLLYPQIVWRQNGTDVVLTIILPDIKDFTFNVLTDRRTVTFRTLKMVRDYGFSLQLYGRMLTEYKTHLTGQYLRITLKKRLIGAEWPRILYDPTEKNRFLKVEFVDLSSESGEDADNLPCRVKNQSIDNGDEDDPEALIETMKEKGYLDDSDDDYRTEPDDAGLLKLGDGRLLG